MRWSRSVMLASDLTGRVSGVSLARRGRLFALLMDSPRVARPMRRRRCDRLYARRDGPSTCLDLSRRRFFPPPSSLLTVAQARRSASFAGTPRLS